MGIELCRCGESELPGVCAIESECFTEPWSEGSLREAFADRSYDCVAAMIDGECAGYISGFTVTPESEIARVAVRKEYRRRGIAKSLLDRFILLVRERGSGVCFLDVRAGNAPAIALYRSYGFVPVGVRRGFYSRPTEDGIVMKLDIKDERDE